jgi:phospho-2-dehydro-3-deoxyheptonate aldolase
MSEKQLNGIIIKGIGGFYYIEADGDIYECKARGAFRKKKIAPLAGDNVIITVRENGENTIKGVMLESNLLPGNQKVIPNVVPQSGLSITDGCIGWDETVELIEQMYHSL